jgi:hypothetical protein
MGDLPTHNSFFARCSKDVAWQQRGVSLRGPREPSAESQSGTPRQAKDVPSASHEKKFHSIASRASSRHSPAASEGGRIGRGPHRKGAASEGAASEGGRSALDFGSLDPTPRRAVPCPPDYFPIHQPSGLPALLSSVSRTRDGSCPPEPHPPRSRDRAIRITSASNLIVSPAPGVPPVAPCPNPGYQQAMSNGAPFANLTVDAHASGPARLTGLLLLLRLSRP